MLTKRKYTHRHRVMSSNGGRHVISTFMRETLVSFPPNESAVPISSYPRRHMHMNPISTRVSSPFRLSLYIWPFFYELCKPKLYTTKHWIRTLCNRYVHPKPNNTYICLNTIYIQTSNFLIYRTDVSCFLHTKAHTHITNDGQTYI